MGCSAVVPFLWPDLGAGTRSRLVLSLLAQYLQSQVEWGSATAWVASQEGPVVVLAASRAVESRPSSFSGWTGGLMNGTQDTPRLRPQSAEVPGSGLA